MEQVCEVCQILDEDESLKPCTYCHFCKAYVCDKDLRNWTRRSEAAVKKMLRFVKGDN